MTEEETPEKVKEETPVKVEEKSSEEVKKEKPKETNNKNTDVVSNTTNYIIIGAIGVAIVLFIVGLVILSAPEEPHAVDTLTDGQDNTDNSDDVIIIDEPSELDVISDTGDNLVILEFGEFKCPYCAAAAGFGGLNEQFKSQDPNWEAPLPKIKEVYGDKVEIVFKHFIVHNSARKAGEALECARDQGKLWEMHDIMFDNMADLKSDDLKALAIEIGLDSEEFDACLDSGEKASIVDSDTAYGRKLGVSSTPTFFIGGESGVKIVGAQPFVNFKDTINSAIGEDPSEPSSGQNAFKTFKSRDSNEICTDEGKPIIRLFSTSWCPHCKWIKETFESIVQEYIDDGKIVAYHWELDEGDDTLTPEEETEVPKTERAIYRDFNSKGSIPTFVFGCKYYRVGNGYEKQNKLENEAQEFRQVIDALLKEVAA